MSFRARMLLFFVIIVVIPMIAVAVVLSSLTERSEEGRADSQVAQALEVAIALYEESRAEAVDELQEIQRDEDLREGLTTGAASALRDVVGRLTRESRAIEAIAVYDQNRERIAFAGADDALAYEDATPTLPDGEQVGRIAVSTTTAQKYVREVARLTDLDARVVRDEAAIAGTLPPAAADEPLATELESAGREFRGRYVVVQDAVGPPLRIGVFQSGGDLVSSGSERALVWAILLAFFLLAIASSIMIVRSLGSQIDRFLGAARAVGRGNFDARVPSEGGDEFAALGREFNMMSAQLKENVEELERRRQEREDAIRRIGDAFAAGLDRDGIARLAAHTAVEACGAESGQAVPGELGEIEPTAVGEDDSELRTALEAAARAVREEPEETAVVVRANAHALGAALRGGPEADGHRQMLGYLTIARRGAEFESSERELFAYLAAQASVSLDNASLHEAVQAQARTDSLTGLSNRRHFDTALEAEIGRSRRFGGEVGLVMVDLDGFKPINDLYGHQEGDRVLIEVAQLLRRLTRDVDQLARYGGDEIAIILPQTDLQGAEQLAERVRAGVEALAFHPAEAGAPLTLTASFGAAAIPESAVDGEGLIAAADAALYQSKRAGGNRVARADPAPLPS